MSNVKWIPAAWINAESELPDDDEVVLIWSDGEPWTGFHEANVWHYVSGDPIGTENAVTHWMPFPEGP